MKDTRKTALVACRRKALLVTKNGLHAAASAADPDPRNLARPNVYDVNMAENEPRGLAADAEAAAHKSRRARVSADADPVPGIVFLHVGRTAAVVVVVVVFIRTIILAVEGVELLVASHKVPCRERTRSYAFRER